MPADHLRYGHDHHEDAHGAPDHPFDPTAATAVSRARRRTGGRCAAPRTTARDPLSVIPHPTGLGRGTESLTARLLEMEVRCGPGERPGLYARGSVCAVIRAEVGLSLRTITKPSSSSTTCSISGRT
jgi:hypothetical protein